MSENTILDSLDVRQGEDAGFFLRLGAYLIDGILLGIINFVIGMVVGMILPEAIAGFVGMGIGILIGLAYFAYMESSEKQATFGKQALGIIVTDMEGRRITTGNAVVRYLSKILSGLILGIGFLMVLFTERKQGLHDIIAKTLVIKSK